MLVKNRNNEIINLQEVKSEILNNNDTLRVNIINNIGIVTFQGYQIKNTTVGDVIYIDLPGGVKAKRSIYGALFTNSKTPSAIMAWVGGNQVKLYSVSINMDIIGNLVFEIE